MVDNIKYYINEFELGMIVWLEFKHAKNWTTDIDDNGTDGTPRYMVYLGHTNNPSEFHFAAIGIYYCVKDEDIISLRRV